MKSKKHKRKSTTPKGSARSSAVRRDLLHQTYFKQARKAGYKAMVALMFGPFKLSNPSHVTGFTTEAKATDYASKLQAEFPKARIEVVMVN
jgi:hypothetical protein